MLQYGFPDSSELSRLEDQMLEMLIQSDDDFVPPLSKRSSTTQKSFLQTPSSEGGIKAYFDEMKKQKFMVCTDGDVLVAFVSYKENYTNDVISEDMCPNIYLSTLVMRPQYRGQGVTKKLYKQLFEHYLAYGVYTRTWSTNIAHIKILESFCFEKICTIANDRGESIDTIYFAKR